ncbi:MAG TPA: hypothetical protein VMW93_06315 [bacterium]|nr:hypothetical protein [bacterium]
MLKKTAILCLALALSAGVAAARFDVYRGNITEDTTWKRSQGPYYIYGDLEIKNGATLTIEAGVEVRFDEVKGTGGYEDGAEIVVRNGYLIAQGKSGLPVKFTSANRVKKMGDWGAIIVEYGNQYILENAIIEYATNGLRLQSTTSNGASGSSANGTIIRHCLNNGVYADGACANLYHVSAEHNGYAGVKTSGNCSVAANYCDLSSNGVYNFYNGWSNNVDATNCWWGTTNTYLIDMRIYDKKDNSTRGVVDYTPYLEAPWRDAGGVANYSTGLIKSLFK